MRSASTQVDRGPLSVAVGIATIGRPEVVIETIARLGRQARAADRIIVCAPKASDVAGVAQAHPHVELVIGPRGLCVQRNAIFDALGEETDILVFFDDDFIPGAGYLAAVERAMRRWPDVAMTTGNVLADGIGGPGLSMKEADHIVDNVAGAAESLERCDPVENGYGCNMSVRMNLVRRHGLRFDANLPLYCWFEDVDFSRRLAAYGRIVKLYGSCGVHMGIKSGRLPGKRLGYSQVANPLYLYRKGTLSFKRTAYQVTKNLLVNLVKSIAPEEYIDRRGRLAGNMLALRDTLQGRADPNRILSL